MSQLSTRLRTFIIAIGVCVALSPFLFNPLSRHIGEGETSPSNMLPLEAPPFMRGVEAASLSQNSNVNYGYFSDNAGIAAYTQLELTADDLNTFKDSNIITVSGEEEGYYVAGTMTALGYEDFPQPIIERMGIQIYVDINGWVVAFLQKDQPTSRIINWLQFDSLTLENEVREIAESILNKRVSEISFYHFQYEATGLFIAGDAAITEIDGFLDTFRVTIPNNFLIQESSWSHMIDVVHSSNCGIQSGSTFGNGLGYREGKWIEVGQISPKLKEGSYTIEMNKSNSLSYRGPVHCGIALIYAEGGN